MMRARFEIAGIFFVALLVFWIETVAFLSEMPFWGKLILHIIIVNGCVGISLLYSRLGCDLRFAVYLTILVAALGPFGAFVSMLTTLLYAFLSRTSENIQDFFASLFPDNQSEMSADLYERIMHGLDKYDEDYNPLPFMDVIEFGTEKQKRLAIEKILRFFRPEFAPSLLKALDDPSNGIRVLAATAVNTLDRHFFERFLSLQNELQEDPENYKLTLQFSIHCDQYAQSQILDEARLNKMVYNAIHGYRKVVESDPKNIYAVSNLARLCVEYGDPSFSCALLEPLISSLEEVPSEISKWYMAALFKLGEFDKLREFSATNFQFAEEQTTAQDVKELIWAWSGHT